MEDGIAAYDKGNYTTAYKFFSVEAEKGNARAQHYLGVMFHNGQGVLQDYNEAAKWWRLAADQGDTTAKCNLAEMYAVGVGIKKDLAAAKKFAKEGFDAGDKYCQELWDEYNLANY
jgi:TPR repeat protein